MRDPAEREAALTAALPQVIAAAKENAPSYRERLAKIRPEDVTDRRALVDLPLTRKSDLIEMQRRNPPFGGLAAVPVSGVGADFRLAGPIYEPEARRPISFAWRAPCMPPGSAPATRHNTFSYHLTPAGAMVESAALALGCPVIPAGTGQTETQLRTIADLRPRAISAPPPSSASSSTGPPTGASIMGPLKAHWSAARLSRRHCARVRRPVSPRCNATPPPISASSRMKARSGRRAGEGMLLDEGIIVEIVHPGTGDPVAPDEVGEIVVTTLTPEYPLIRFATGDLRRTCPAPARAAAPTTASGAGSGAPTGGQSARSVHPSGADRRDHAPAQSDHPGAARRRAPAKRRRDDARRNRRAGRAGGRDRGDLAAVTKLRGAVGGCRKGSCRMTARSSRTGARSGKFLVILHQRIAAIAKRFDPIERHLPPLRVYPCRFVPQTPTRAPNGTGFFAAPDSPSGAAFFTTHPVLSASVPINDRGLPTAVKAGWPAIR